MTRKELRSMTNEKLIEAHANACWAYGNKLTKGVARALDQIEEELLFRLDSKEGRV